MSTVISLLAYSKTIAMNEGNAGAVIWLLNRETLFVYGSRVEMRMVHNFLCSTTEILLRDLMWVANHDQFAVDVDVIVDNIAGQWCRQGAHNS